jgi:hypothetical protein
MLRFKNTKIGRKSLDLLQREWVVFAFRKVVVLCLIALALVGALGALILYMEYDSWHAEAQLEAASNEGRVQGPWLRYDLICFNNITAQEWHDFPDALRKAKHDVTNFSGSSCNGVFSNELGVIGFVSGDKIQCTVVHFFYVLEETDAACIPPRRLSVTKQIFKTDGLAPGRMWKGVSGQAYYSIREVER